MKYPILDHYGRTVLGQATTVHGARHFLMKTLGDHSLSLIKKHGFTLKVWLREAWVAEMNGGLVGWMYSIGK